MKFKLLLTFILTLGSLSAYAGNPGKSAMNCIEVSNSSDDVIFKNTCNYKVFLVWCGDLTYTRKRCGDGPRDSFYTQSDNLGPYDTKKTSVKGSYKYAACKGSIGFGSKGIEHPNSDRGRFRCVKIGRD